MRGVYGAGPDSRAHMIGPEMGPKRERESGMSKEK